MTESSINMASLTSKDFHSKLFQNMLALDDFLDAVISAEGKNIQAHRFVLAAGSKYFHRMLTCTGNSIRCPILVFTDVKFEHIKRIVQFLYTGKTEVPQKELNEFLSVTRKLEILGFGDECRAEELISVSGAGSMVSITSKPPNLQITYEILSNDDAEKNPSTARKSKRNLDLDNTHHSTQESTADVNEVSNSRKRARITIDPIRSSNQFSASNMSVNAPAAVASTSQSSDKTSTEKPTPTPEPTPPPPPKSNSSNEQDKNCGQEPILVENMHSDEECDEEVSHYTCSSPECGKRFVNTLEMVRHKMNKCGKKEEFQCETCKKTFNLRIGLQNHTKRCPKNVSTNKIAKA